MHLKTLLFSYFLIFLTTANRADAGEGDAVLLRAVRGQDARIPCGQNKIFLDGPKSYVIWMKNNKRFVYRFPRDKDHARARYGTPCDAGICRDDTSLLIMRASVRDAGMYSCRIHYQGSPAVDFVYELKIVEPIRVPKLYSGTGEFLNKGFVGPLSLQSDLVLICEVEDKENKTEVYWRRNGALIPNQSSTYDGCVVHVQIGLYNLSRAEVNARFECLAQNSDVSEPMVVGVVLKMYTPPLSIEIRMDNNSDFEAGQPRVVDCVVVGCMPAPAISWHLGKTLLRPSVHKEQHDGNYTVSSLTLAPSLRDNRSDLVCQAYNSLMLDRKFQTKVTVNVGFRPICAMTSEPRIGAVAGEAEDVICVVESSPEPLQFIWTFSDSNTVYTSPCKMEAFRNRYQSRLKWVARGREMGILTCSATNKFGEMKKPCTFNISAGGPPAQPDCEVTRIYTNSLRVHCDIGWDGGRPQMIHLDLVDEVGVRVKNVTDATGRFFVPKYDNKHNLTAVLYATNSRGKSQDRVVYLYSLVPVSEAKNYYVPASWMPCVKAAVGGVTLFIILTACILGLRRVPSDETMSDVSPDIGTRSDGELIAITAELLDNFSMTMMGQYMYGSAQELSTGSLNSYMNGCPGSRVRPVSL